MKGGNSLEFAMCHVLVPVHTPNISIMLSTGTTQQRGPDRSAEQASSKDSLRCTPSNRNTLADMAIFEPFCIDTAKHAPIGESVDDPTRLSDGTEATAVPSLRQAASRQQETVPSIPAQHQLHGCGGRSWRFSRHP